LNIKVEDTVSGLQSLGVDGSEPLKVIQGTSMVVPCPLGLLPDRQDVVWPEIPQGADILNIGEAPGNDEVGHKPFVGQSGRLLRRWLDQEGLLTRSAFVNVEGHQPYDLTCRKCGIEFWYSETKFRTAVEARYRFEHEEGRHPKPPTKTQIATLDKWAASDGCSHIWRRVRLNREPHDPKTGECCGLPIINKLLSSGRFKIVLLWGGTPGRRVGGYAGAVGSMVGRFRTLPSGATATVLYHPAYALRQRGTPEYAVTESLEKEILQQVYDRLENARADPGYSYTTVATRWPIYRVRDPLAVIDIETDPSPLRPEKDKNKPDPRIDHPKTLCIGSLDNNEVLLKELQPNYRLIFPQDNVRITTHNGLFDLPIIMRLSGRYDIDADDTMVMAYLDGESQLSLKILGRRRLGRQAREYKETDGDDAEYAAQDPHLTRDLRAYYEPRLRAKGLWWLYENVKMPLVRIMSRHIVQGLRIDQDRMAILRNKMLTRADFLRQHMFNIVGREFNLGKTGITDEVRHILYEEMGIPPMEVRRGKSVTYEQTTNEAHLAQFQHIPFVSALLSFRRAAGYESRYTGPLSEVQRVSGLYDLTGTGTDRVSQSRRNCMNFPLLVKQCIQADEGGYFVYGDYSQIELRLAAYFSRDEYLLSVIREGRNMHEELCLAVYGARTPETYTQAKSSNFAKLFGAGLARRAKTLKKPISVVRRTEIPWDGWDAWVANRIHEPAKTYWGYERNISDAIESADEYVRDKANRQIINSIIQGTAGETNQYAQVLADRDLKQLGGYVIHQEHDSVLGWVPNSIDPKEATECLAAAMKRAVPEEIQEVIEIRAKVVYGSHWG